MRSRSAFRPTVTISGSRPADADLVLAWQAGGAASGAAREDAAMIFAEEVQLVCSPGFAASHADVLRGPAADWSELTFLDMERPDPGWTSWSDWFGAAGGPQRPPRYVLLDSYIQVLEAAAAGDGIALGWRHYIERYLDSGAVVMLGEEFVLFGNRFVATLTEKGRQNPNVQACLSFFGGLA